MFFKSLKKEILIFIIGLITVAVFIIIALAVFSIQTAGRDAQQATSEVLREQAKESLVQIVTSAANQQDLLFEHIRNETSILASYVKNIHENPSVFSQRAYWEFDDRVFQKNGNYVNDAADISTIHIPSFVVLDSNEKRNIELTAYLDFIAPSILKNNQNAVATWVVDEKGATRYFPNIILGNIAPNDYDPRNDIFFKPATPKENPDKHVVWSSLYDDPAKRGLMITATAPIYTKNGFAGVVGIDVLLESLITTITAYNPLEGSYAFLIDKEGNTIAFPDQAYEDILGRPRGKGEVRTSLAGSSPALHSILQEMMNGAKGFGSISSGKRTLFIAYAPLQQTNFSMAIVVEEATMLKAAHILGGEILNSAQNTIVKKILPVSLFIILLASIASIFLVARIIGPIRQLTAGAREIGSGNLDYNIKVNSKNEIGNLASSFTQMSQDLKQSRKKLKEYSEGLEEKVKERTHELLVANTDLKRLDQTKTEFMSIASHQLRTPLTVIKGYVSLALDGTLGVISQPVKESLAKAAFSTEKLIKLVNEFLNLSRMEAGKIEYKMVPNNLSFIIRGVMDELKSEALQKAITLTLEPKKDIEQFIFDGDKMREVITNLVDNAVKYSLNGAICIRQEIVTQDRKQFVRISVKDNGMGIAKKDISRLFTKFVRSAQAKEIDANGLGLGLFFVKKVVEDHGGKAWAESEGLGKGSTFFIEIPFKQHSPSTN